MFENKWTTFAIFILIGVATALIVTGLVVAEPVDQERSQNLVVLDEEFAHDIGRDCVTNRTRTTSFWSIRPINKPAWHNGHWYVSHWHQPRPINLFGRGHTTVSKCTPSQVQRANYPWMF